MTNKRLSIKLLFFLCTILISACAQSSQAPKNIEQSPGIDHPETSGFRVVTREEIKPPIPAFNFSLVNQNGEILQLEDLSGSVVMISFLYTHCPEACPLVAANFKNVQGQLSEAVTDRELIQVLVTTDPERDTPDRLLRYTQALDGQWYFLTGTFEQVQEVWDAYDIYHEIRERTEEIVVFHSYKTYLIDHLGNLKFEFVGVWYPDDILPDIKSMLIQTEEFIDAQNDQK